MIVNYSSVKVVDSGDLRNFFSKCWRWPYTGCLCVFVFSGLYPILYFPHSIFPSYIYIANTFIICFDLCFIFIFHTFEQFQACCLKITVGRNVMPRSLADIFQHFKVTATSNFGVEEFSFISTKIVARGFSETSVFLYQTVWHRISQTWCPYSYRYSLKYLTALCSVINYTVNNSDPEYCRMIVWELLINWKRCLVCHDLRIMGFVWRDRRKPRKIPTRLCEFRNEYKRRCM